MRAEKQLLLDEIKEKIEGSKGFIVANYKLTSSHARDFRQQLEQAQGEFEVVRKKVFLKALEKCGITFSTELEGHIGVVFVQGEITAVSKAAVQFGKNQEGTIQVLGGHVEGESCSAADILEISNLPTLDVLRAQFLGLLEAPMTEMVTTIDALLTSVLYCLEEKSAKEES